MRHFIFSADALADEYSMYARSPISFVIASCTRSFDGLPSSMSKVSMWKRPLARCTSCERPSKLLYSEGMIKLACFFSTACGVSTRRAISASVMVLYCFDGSSFSVSYAPSHNITWHLPFGLGICSISAIAFSSSGVSLVERKLTPAPSHRCRGLFIRTARHPRQDHPAPLALAPTAVAVRRMDRRQVRPR